MTQVNVPLATLDRLSDVALSLAGDLTDLFVGGNQESDQLSFHFADDMAIEAFMEEREELKSRVTYLEGDRRQIMGALQAELQGRSVYQDAAKDIAEERDNLIKQMIQVAGYVGQLRDRLALIGITIAASEAGEPDVTIDADVLIPVLVDELAPGLRDAMGL